MGMLLHRHRKARAAAVTTSKVAQPRNRRNRKAKAKAAEQPKAPATQVTPYAELDDDQLLEAYSTNVGGNAESRDDMVAELAALDTPEQ